MVRAWRWWAVGMVLGCGGMAWGVTLPQTAADMEAANGTAAVGVRDAVLRAAPAGAVARAAYAEAATKEFEKELSSKNADARLNTAILFVKLESLACDRVLETMLKNSDPAVRLWGAKGLKALAPNVKKVGGSAVTRAVTALKDADTAEAPGVVKDAIGKALAEY